MKQASANIASRYLKKRNGKRKREREREKMYVRLRLARDPK